MPPESTVTIDQAISVLRSQASKGNDFYLRFAHDLQGIANWTDMTKLCIEKVFGAGHPYVKEFFEGKIAASNDGFISEREKKGRSYISPKLRLLKIYIDQLEVEAALKKPVAVNENTSNSQPSLSNKVFIVHGHDGELKEATARLVSKFNLEPVILHEQARQGRTIIESFSAHAKESGFAIVLLTADDVGSAGTVAEHAALQARARQNVIFEMGFFVGLLGLGRVCAIYEAGVEMPSDLGGILYIQYDVAGRWQWDIAKEIRAAGYKIDLNKL